MNQFMRTFKLQFMKFFFDHRLNVLKKTNSQKILVLRLDDKLGDCVVSTGFLSSIKKAFPSSKLIVLTGSSTASLYQKLTFVDEVRTLNKGLLNSLNSYVSLRSSEYRYIINTSHILNPRVIFHLSQLRAQDKLGFLNKTFNLFTQHIQYEENTDHVTKRYAAVLKAMGVQDFNLSYKLPLDNKKTEKVSALLPDNKKIIILNSFAGARLRNFDEETTLALVKELLQDSQNFIISIASKSDHQILKNWIKKYNNPNWQHFAQLNSLEDNCALVALADVIITPDTAWVHIASALNKELVAVYRRDGVEKNSLIWAPLGKHVQIVYADSQDDINQVDVKKIVQAVEAYGE